MDYRLYKIDEYNIFELTSDEIVVHNLKDALELMGNAFHLGSDRVILYQKQLCPEFFDLKNRIAGDIFQKFVTYRMKLVIIGEFEDIKSKSLHDFIYESNKTGQIIFVETLDKALELLA